MTSCRWLELWRLCWRIPWLERMHYTEGSEMQAWNVRFNSRLILFSFLNYFIFHFMKGFTNVCPYIVEIRGTQGFALVGDRARALILIPWTTSVLSISNKTLNRRLTAQWRETDASNFQIVFRFGKLPDCITAQIDAKSKRYEHVNTESTVFRWWNGSMGPASV